MLCRKCRREYDDELFFCPYCKTKNDNRKAFDFPDDEAEVTNGEKQQEEEIIEAEEKQESIQQEKADNIAEEDGFEKEEISEKEGGFDNEEEFAEKEKASQELAEKKDENEIKPEGRQIEAVRVKKVKKSSEMKRKKKVKPFSAKPTPAERANLNLVMCLLVLVLVSAVMLTFISVKTDVFTPDDDTVKTVALSGLTEEETEALQAHLLNCYSVFSYDFDSTVTGSEAFLSRLNPGDSSNVFRKLIGNVTVQTEADPDFRFRGEDGLYSYVKIPEADVDGLLESFNLGSYHEMNSEKGYYYKGYYYLAYNEAQEDTAAVFAEVAESKKVTDGSFYAECRFYRQGNEDGYDARYIQFEKNTDENGKHSFKIIKFGSEPLDTQAKLPEGVSKWTLKREKIDCKTSAGILFRSYVIEYPVFEGETAGEQSVNKFFSDIVAVYKLSAASAEKDYADFIKNGGKKEDLPFTHTVISTVTRNDAKRISIVENITSYSPALPVAEQENEEEALIEEGITLPEKKIEAYSFNKKTGGYITKDEVVSKDYVTVSEVLYRIYGGYRYNDIIYELKGGEDYYSEEDYDYDAIPTDSEKIGARIYESPWAVTETGVCFYLVTEEGYIKEVEIPLKVAVLLLKVQQASTTETTEATEE